MNRFITPGLVLVALVGAMTTVTTSKAEAALQLFLCTAEFCNGGSVTTIDDNGAGDTNATAGVVNWSGAFDGFTLSIDAAFGVPFLGTGTSPQLDLLFSAFGAGNGYIYAQQGEFTLPQPATFGLKYGGTTTGHTWVQAIIGHACDPWTTVGPFTGAFSGTVGVSNVGPYYQAIGVHIVQGEGGATTGDLHLVPEPVTLSLLGLGLAGVAARRRRQNA
jgi:hypothetical protein